MNFLESREVRLYLPMKHIPSDIQRLHRMFQKAGKHLYVVGGAVRDHVLGRIPKDYDLSTNAKPEEIIEILKDNGIKSTKGAVGNQFGVIVATLSDDYEISTFRKDSGDRQKADTFSNIEDDSARRDLTINALFYDLNTDEIIDLVGGIEDIKKGRVKTVGDPDKRFGEDTLRVLRYIRFYCRVNAGDLAGIDQETRKAIAKRVDNGLKSDNGVAVAPERIRDEFLKGLKSSVSIPGYLSLYHQVGLLERYVFRGLNVSHDYADARNPVLVISHLLRNNDVEQIRKKLNELKYTNEEINDIVYLVNLLHLHKIDDKLKEQPNFLYQLRLRQRDPEDLNAWMKLHGLSPEEVEQLRSYQLKNRDEIPGAAALQGKEIGQHIVKHNTDEMLRKMRFREWLESNVELQGFHATANDFTGFDEKHFGKRSKSDATALGVFFYNNLEDAQRIYLPGKRRILKCKVKMHNPFTFKKYSELYDYVGVDYRNPNKAAEVTKQLKKMGHDGFIKSYQSKDGIDEFVVFNVANISSVEPV